MSLVNVSFRTDFRVLSRIITNTRRLQSIALLDALDLNPEANEVLRRLRRYFPVSRDSGEKKRTQGSKNELEELGVSGHLVDYFDVDVGRTASGGFSISLNHALSHIPRVAEILQTLDTGSKQTTWYAKEAFVFPDSRSISRQRKIYGKARGSFTWIAKGSVINKPAREGSHYTDKTYDFVINTIFPRIRRKVEQVVENEMR